MASNMDLAIIIVNLNVGELLKQCLTSVYDSLALSDGLRVQVLVVDNASIDGSAELVRQEFPQVLLMALDKNLGFAGANNLALQVLGFREIDSEAVHSRDLVPQWTPKTPFPLPRHVLLLNPDTLVTGTALETMVCFLDDYEKTGACGANLSYPGGRFQHGAFRFPGLAQIALDFFPPPGRLNTTLLDSAWNGRYSHSLYEGTDPFPVDFVLGAALMVRGDTIRQVGLFNESYFMYCEEMDWQRRMRQAGWQVHCLPSAHVIHYGGASTSQFKGPMMVALWRSRFRYFQRYHGPLFYLAATALVKTGIKAERQRAVRAQPEDMAARLAAYEQINELADA
ncbi:MAG: glycosyltransferase family 2 protein [Chloroflexota bacterium]|nr:glycosyltransferase family 2 protein [Chloroflexota bacterium]